MFKKKTKEVTKDDKAFLERRKSLQEMLPIKDVIDGCFVNEHGRYFPVIELGSINFDLMSADEREKLVQQLIISFGSFNFNQYQIFVVPVPFDIDLWLSSYNERYDNLRTQEDSMREAYEAYVQKNDSRAYRIADDLHFNRQMQIHVKNEIEFVIQNIVEGGMTTKKSYFIPVSTDNNDKTQMLKISGAIVNSFKSMNISAKLCSDVELRTLLVVALNPKNPDLIKPSAGKTLPVRSEYLYGGNK